MLPSSSDKKNLIEAMKKLTYYISDNNQRQKQIFDSIAKDDLRNILNNLEDENQYLRRISALLICQLLYNNKQLKQEFIQKIGIPINEGRILLNKIPQSLQKMPNLLIKSMQLMKGPIKAGQQNMFCWAINFDKKYLTVDYFQFKKYSSFTFLDPMRSLFGITIQAKNQSDNISARIGTDGSTRSSDVKKIGDKNYNIMDRKFVEVRTSNSKQHRGSVSSSEGKQRVLGYKKWRESFSGKHPQYAETSKKSASGYNTKYGSSIQSISQYARNSHGDRKNDYPRQNLTFHEQTTGRANTQREYRDHTQRESGKRSSFYETSGVQLQHDRTGNNKNKYHDNFYRRVQEILRK